MRTTGRTSRSTRALSTGLLIGALALGLTATTVPAGAEVSDPTQTTPTQTTPAPADTTPAAPTSPSIESADETQTEEPGAEVDALTVGTPYGADFPVTLESNFARPYKSISSSANSDFSQLNDLERLIEGSYLYPNPYPANPALAGKYRPDASSNRVRISISRMENSHRVGRRLIKAAQRGVEVYVIHGKASQSKESRALQSALGKLKHGHFHICTKGRSNACLSGLRGAIMHTKILLVDKTFTRTGEPALGAIWSGSANLGGPSGERTYNNGLTIYNDKKLFLQTHRMWGDMWSELNVGNDYLKYIANHASRYGYTGAKANDGYSRDFASFGMFYSNLANATIYATPIAATPSNGKDPVLNLLNRIKPDDQCRIRLQQNRFKYRRIAVAQKLVELADQGCTVSAVSFEDDLTVNRVKHCQQYIRICRPILDVFKTASRHIDVAWAKPHDKTILVDAVLGPNRLNTEEELPTGGTWPQAGVRVKLVQAGSAALTGSNLVSSDEITTETTDSVIYEDYLEHWKAISNSKSPDYRLYPY